MLAVLAFVPSELCKRVMRGLAKCKTETDTDLDLLTFRPVISDDKWLVVSGLLLNPAVVGWRGNVR